MEKLEQNEEDTLNEELDVAVGKLAKGALNSFIEDPRSRKSALIERKGRRLAEKLETKWYNKGEKSTRYFMRLLNRASPDKSVKLEDSNGITISDKTRIEEEITKFHKNL